MFSNRLNNLVNSSNKKDVISYCQNKNTKNPQLLAIKKDRVAKHSKLEKQIDNAKRNMSNVNIFYWGIIKYN